MVKQLENGNFFIGSDNSDIMGNTMRVSSCKCMSKSVLWDKSESYECVERVGLVLYGAAVWTVNKNTIINILIYNYLNDIFK